MLTTVALIAVMLTTVALIAVMLSTLCAGFMAIQSQKARRKVRVRVEDR